MIIFMIIIKNNHLIAVLAVIPLMNITSSVRELSALIILVSDTLHGKPMIHSTAGPSHVVLQQSMTLLSNTYMKLISQRKINGCKPLIHTVYLNVFFL